MSLIIVHSQVSNTLISEYAPLYYTSEGRGLLLEYQIFLRYAPLQMQGRSKVEKIMTTLAVLAVAIQPCTKGNFLSLLVHALPTEEWQQTNFYFQW